MEGKQALDNLARYCSDIRIMGKARKELNNELDILFQELDKLDKVKVIIKLIKEKIENARLDYQCCFEEIDTPLCKSDDLRGQILAYQDVLFMLERIFNK